MYKPRIKPYTVLYSSVSRCGKTEIGVHTKQSDKTNLKKKADYSYRERFEKLESTTLPERKMKVDQFERFKIIN